MPAIFNTDYQISIWRPYGKISLEFLVDEIKEFTKVEKSYPKFNRFADISECDFSLIKYEDIKQIYMKRKLDYSGPPVLSVFFIKTSLQYGVTRIYQTLMDDSQISVEILKTKKECADLLNIPLEVLFP